MQNPDLRSSLLIMLIAHTNQFKRERESKRDRKIIIKTKLRIFVIENGFCLEIIIDGNLNGYDPLCLEFEHLLFVVNRKLFSVSIFQFLYSKV